MKSKYISILLVFTILVACAPKAEQTSNPTSLPGTVTPTKAVIRTTLTKTTTLTSTMTSTALPTLTSTPIPPTPTRTLMPTLNSTVGFNTLMSYYENNGGCQLPCWWGITPGKTTWDEARSKLSIISSEMGPFIKAGLPAYDYSFDVPMNVDPLGLGFFEPRLWVDHNTIYGINLNTGWIQKGVDYSLSFVLKEFGKPNEIWIDLETDVQDKPHYELDLFYPFLGLLFNSTGDGEFIGSGVEICPQGFRRGLFPAAVTLFPPRVEISYVELKNLLFDWSANEFDFIKLISISDGFDETEFYQTYQDPNTNICFHTNK